MIDGETYAEVGEETQLGRRRFLRRKNNEELVCRRCEGGEDAGEALDCLLYLSLPGSARGYSELSYIHFCNEAAISNAGRSSLIL
jgi:hypothetical protein